MGAHNILSKCVISSFCSVCGSTAGAGPTMVSFFLLSVGISVDSSRYRQEVNKTFKKKWTATQNKNKKRQIQGNKTQETCSGCWFEASEGLFFQRIQTSVYLKDVCQTVPEGTWIDFIVKKSAKSCLSTDTSTKKWGRAGIKWSIT